MAKNWTIAEAIVKINEGDFASIKDIGGRFALFEHLCAKAIAGDGEAFVELMRHMPEYMTVGKVEKLLKAEVSEDADDDADDAEEEKVVEEKPAKKGRSKKKDEPVEEDKAGEDEEKSYEDMTAKELFNLCKERKIKAEPKQKASAYIKLLKAADKAAEKKKDEDDDDWDDGEEEEKKPAKKAEKKKPEPKEDDDEDWDI